jgi:chromosome segregation ATPase
LQKYAAIKEREAREKEATIQVLKGQLAKMETKLTRSESERRRLTLENDELKTQMSTIEEELSQKKFYLQKVEAQHQEELRGINMRLDNAIFQANKAQNRLEDFRERVRNDFVKIRAQERELFNKLELQKRDAEALLASKDEQLLNQRREIDRLQYELETLQEKMMEETERAEERASRLSRALQSLKLATDMLSGLTEEVLPSAGERFPDSKQESEDEAA